MTVYEIEPDLTFWIPVPREFPDDTFETAEEWAEDIATVAIPDDDDLRATYRRLALDVANNQFEDSSHTFWYSPEDGHALGTAHLSIFEDALDLTLEELADPGYESVTPFQKESFTSQVFGTVIQSASTISSDPRAMENLEASSAIGHIRTVGRSHDMVFVLEAYDADLAVLGFMMEPMVEFFESVSFVDDDNREKD